MRSRRISILLGTGAAALLTTVALSAPAYADPSVAGVWMNQFGNVLVAQTAPGQYSGTMLNSFTTPVACPGTSNIVVQGQRVWTFAAAAAPGFTGTYNFIRNGTTEGCPGGNTQVPSIDGVIEAAAPAQDRLRICFANPQTGDPAVFDNNPGPTNCEDETRLGTAASVTVTHKLTDYLNKITGGACVSSGPRTVSIKFRDDFTLAGAPGISDPIVKARFYDSGHLDKGYNIDSAQDFPNDAVSGNFSFESNTLHGLWIKVVMTSFAGKTYTIDTRHLPHALLAHPLPQNCKKTSNNS